MKLRIKNTDWGSKSIERNLFYLFSILNVLPVFLVRQYASLDGPQHLYISNVIGELWKSNELFQQFFKFNDIIVGNWTGHFLLSVFNYLLPGWIAEKLLLATYLLGLAFSFRYLIFSIKGSSSFISFLIFPISYTTLFHFGYYNFNIATAVMLFTFGYWLRIENNLKISKALVLLLLITLLFLSHVFVYTFFGFSIALYLIITFISDFIINTDKRNTIRRSFIKLINILFASSVSLVLWYYYWASIPGYSKSSGFSFPELVEHLYNFRSLIGFHYQAESYVNNYLFVLLCFLLIFGIITRIIARKKSKNNSDSLFGYFKKYDFWLLLSFVFLALYFIIPDRLSAGSISTRLSILFFLFLITWLSVQDYPRWITLVSVIIIIIYSINIRNVQMKFLYALEKDITEIKELNEYIEPNTLIYHENYSTNWIQLHSQYYIGVDKPVIHVTSPQCYGPFPVVWNKKQRPVVYLGGVDLYDFCSYCSSRDKTRPTLYVDYIIIWGANNFNQRKQNEKIGDVLEKYYEKVYTSSYGKSELYKLKK